MEQEMEAQVHQLMDISLQVGSLYFATWFVKAIEESSTTAVMKILQCSIDVCCYLKLT